MKLALLSSRQEHGAAAGRQAVRNGLAKKLPKKTG